MSLNLNEVISVLQPYIMQVTGYKVRSESGDDMTLILFVCVAEPSCTLHRRNRVLHAVLHQGQRANGTQIHVRRWRQSCVWVVQVSALNVCVFVSERKSVRRDKERRERWLLSVCAPSVFVSNSVSVNVQYHSLFTRQTGCKCIQCM